MRHSGEESGRRLTAAGGRRLGFQAPARPGFKEDLVGLFQDRDLDLMYGAKGVGEDGTVTPDGGQPVDVSVRFDNPEETAGIPGLGVSMARAAATFAAVPAHQVAGLVLEGAVLAVTTGRLVGSWRIKRGLPNAARHAVQLQLGEKLS